MESIWQKNVVRPTFKPLRGDASTDVLIIGGGMAGVLCAYALCRAGVDCLLVEADRIGSGVTQNTTAKLTVQHGLIYDEMIGRFGVEKARLYVKAQTAALDAYRRLCQDIDCDFEEADSVVYSLDDRKRIDREAKALKLLGCHALVEDHLPLPVSVAGAVRVKGQAQFHPLKFLYGVAEGLPIHELTEVTEMTSRGILTTRGRIRAKKVIVATHFPMLNKHGSYFLKMYQQRSYVLALENASPVAETYVDGSGKGLSFREYNGWLLLGGGGHRTGKTGGGWRELSAFAARHYPHAREVARWATQDCMTLDGMPYIGQYSARTPDLYVATGFNKWGMTSSMVAAMLLCSLVQGKTPTYAGMFSPSRSILRPQLAVNAWESIGGLLTPTAPRCPHLGCALHYNKQEHTWDCACHGSRFSGNGKRLDGPATGDMEIKRNIL